MKRLFAIRFISAGCLLLAFTMGIIDIVNWRQDTGDDHGFVIITLLLIASSLELIRAELAALRKKLDDRRWPDQRVRSEAFCGA